VVDELAEWSFLTVPLKKVRVRVQNTVGIPELDSIPLPDLTWVRRKSYRRSRPRISDLLLLIEVSDSTLAYDCGEKAGLYARAGVKDYWVADVRHQTVEVFRKPSAKGYRQRQSFDVSMSVNPLAFPELALPVARLFTFGWTGE
jgi:Uma2 family endonuclease